jgi:hypothetical protein
VRFRRPFIDKLEFANSINVPSGRWPAQGWILLKRSDYNTLTTGQSSGLYATNFKLQMNDVQTGTQVTLQNLVIVQARCVSTGVSTDPNAIYLVEITDQRGILFNPWFQFPTNSQYNVIAPAYPGQYDSASLLAGAPFTWSQMISDLWTQQGTFLGAFPGLPIVPTGTPTNWILPGIPAWDALNNMLALIGCRIAVDLTQAAPYTVVSIGAADAVFAASTARFAGVLEDDLAWIDTGAGRVPAFVVVNFHRRNQYYGTEETVRRDSLQWTTTPSFSVTVAAPAGFTGAVGTHQIWVDFTVQFDIDGNPLATDVATANTIAAERVTQYYNRITRGTAGFMSRVYTGALPFATGSLVDGVRWQQTYQDAERGGWQTAVVRGPEPPWADMPDLF